MFPWIEGKIGKLSDQPSIQTPRVAKAYRGHLIGHLTWAHAIIFLEELFFEGSMFVSFLYILLSRTHPFVRRNVLPFARLPHK